MHYGCKLCKDKAWKFLGSASTRHANDHAKKRKTQNSAVIEKRPGMMPAEQESFKKQQERESRSKYAVSMFFPSFPSNRSSVS